MSGIGLRTPVTGSLREIAPGPAGGPAVLCFPHAGGCASFFHPWRSALAGVRVDAVQYPGREERIAHPPAPSLVALAASIAGEIRAGARRYAVLFGHSMGAYLAFEVAHLLEQAGAPVPTVVVSSAAAPAHRPPVPFRRNDEVLAYLESYEPVDAEVRQDEELLDLILGYLKDDLRLVARYTQHTGKRISGRMVAVAGAADVPGIRGGVARWRDHAAGGFTVRTVPGGHFYLRDDPPLALLADELAGAIGGCAA
ncbi:alpha/beta fold hydrolase [Actinoplanes sp. NPDC051851]|uniref:thioesterase II family protein n=1 Tax=Actinoplanes sp. NPDC051851 TaxID=3154753 RepID=UPI00343D2677